MREIYLDNSATTATDNDVAQVAANMMTTLYGNPSSLHKKGLEAQLLLDGARETLANVLGCEPEEIYFTASGTEANNLALLGSYGAHKRRGNRIVCSDGEHSSVLAPLAHLAEQGAVVTQTKLLPDGHADAGSLVNAVDESTLLLSCMLVNSEVGSISPIEDITRLAKGKNKRLLVHCDGVQALGKIPFSVRRLGVDMLSVSGHKLHAPKGIGALYLKKGVRVLPVLYGGGQERGLRPGTENVAYACAFAHAAKKSAEMLETNLENTRQLREYFVKSVAQRPEICINSPPDAAPYICNISVPGYRSETMLHFLAGEGIYVSSGSACSKGADSHVLSSMGLPPARIKSALRISFNRYNTTEDVDIFFESLDRCVRQIAKSND